MPISVVENQRFEWAGVSVVIPCLNEAPCLRQTIEEACIGIQKSGLPGEIIVADNGSTDGSQGVASRTGVRVVQVPERGYGNAVSAGIRAARFPWIVFGDADGSYPMENLDQLLGPIIQRRAELVLGSRMKGKMNKKAMPKMHRYVGTPVLSFLIRFFFKIPTSDCNSGMRAIVRDSYERLHLESGGMEFASQMLIRASRYRVRYIEIPIIFRKDRRTQRSHLNTWNDGWRHLRTILVESMKRDLPFV